MKTVGLPMDKFQPFGTPSALVFSTTLRDMRNSKIKAVDQNQNTNLPARSPAAGWGDPNWADDAEVYDDGPEVPWGGAAESEDAFAARIWAEMERRRHAAVDAAAA